jgi:hypothetical protein
LRQLSFVRPGVLWRREGRRVSDAIVRWRVTMEMGSNMAWHGWAGVLGAEYAAWRSMA